MKVYDVVIEVKTPLLITTQQLGNILRNSFEVIPGQVFRGALLSKFYREGNEQFVKDEFNNPMLVFHPLYPLINNETPKPANPFMLKCKICGEIFQDKESFQKTINEGALIYNSPVACKNSHIFAVKNIGGILLYKVDGVFKSFDIKDFECVLDSVGINRYFKASETEMLYRYIAIKPGIKFRGYFVDKSDGNRSKILESEDTSFELFMGRGISRGLGLVNVKIVEVQGIVEKRTKRIEQLVEKLNGYLILNALSPIFNLDLRNGAIITTLNFDLQKLGIDAKPVQIHKNGNYLTTGQTRISGFSLQTNLPKAKVTAAREGTLLFYKLSSFDSLSKIAERTLLGFGPFANIGYNIMEVLDYEWFGLV